VGCGLARPHRHPAIQVVQDVGGRRPPRSRSQGRPRPRHARAAGRRPRDPRQVRRRRLDPRARRAARAEDREPVRRPVRPARVPVPRRLPAAGAESGGHWPLAGRPAPLGRAGRVDPEGAHHARVDPAARPGSRADRHEPAAARQEDRPGSDRGGEAARPGVRGGNTGAPARPRCDVRRAAGLRRCEAAGGARPALEARSGR
jgi:hypothetical protein